VSFRAGWVVVSTIGALFTAVACGRGEAPAPAAPSRFELRLRSALGMAPPELSSGEVREALLRQLRKRETLAEFYAAHGDRLVWSDDSGKLLPPGKALVATIARAQEHGLDPQDYALGYLEQLAAAIDGGPIDEARADRLADFDLVATTAFLRYASDVSTGRVHPDEVREDWHTNPPEVDVVAELDRVLGGQDLGSILDGLSPPHPGYARLRGALRALREIEAAGGWPAVSEGPKLVPGARGPRVALLRQRLGQPPGELFDRALAASVRGFQEQHGIEPDGTVGARTLAELNVPVGQRILEVELNLERWRWIPRRLGDPHVLINIPAFELDFVRNGAPAWRSRIVVGKAFTPTPVFSDRIVAVVVNPPWNVPESIALGELLPELQSDPQALSRRHIRILDGAGDKAREVSPKSVDWSEVAAGRFPYRLRQDPGADNALGRLKFDLTNDFHIYLHDTPAGHLFGRPERDLSHGCIRVERPLELARELLGDSPEDRLQQALDQSEERRLPVEPPVPVHILYWTAWADEADVLHFGPDVYELEGPQRAALEQLASRRP
jgi:L,D-transpeptidase YcbB